MSSSDVTGLLIGLPKAGVIFLYNAPFSKGSASAFLRLQYTHGSTHTIMFTLSKRASVHSQTGSHTPTLDTDRLSKVTHIRSVTSASTSTFHPED